MDPGLTCHLPHPSPNHPNDPIPAPALIRGRTGKPVRAPPHGEPPQPGSGFTAAVNLGRWTGVAWRVGHQGPCSLPHFHPALFPPQSRNCPGETTPAVSLLKCQRSQTPRTPCDSGGAEGDRRACDGAEARPAQSGGRGRPPRRVLLALRPGLHL